MPSHADAVQLSASPRVTLADMGGQRLHTKDMRNAGAQLKNPEFEGQNRFKNISTTYMTLSFIFRLVCQGRCKQCTRQFPRRRFLGYVPEQTWTLPFLSIFCGGPVASAGRKAEPAPLSYQDSLVGDAVTGTRIRDGSKSHLF